MLGEEYAFYNILKGWYKTLTSYSHNHLVIHLLQAGRQRGQIVDSRATLAPAAKVQFSNTV
jgi:hypothetical protein